MYAFLCALARFSAFDYAFPLSPLAFLCLFLASSLLPGMSAIPAGSWVPSRWLGDLIWELRCPFFPRETGPVKQRSPADFFRIRILGCIFSGTGGKSNSNRVWTFTIRRLAIQGGADLPGLWARENPGLSLKPRGSCGFRALQSFLGA